VQAHLYALASVATFLWGGAPPSRPAAGGGWDGSCPGLPTQTDKVVTAALAAAVAMLASWAGVAALMPRPPGCEYAAADASRAIMATLGGA
jgi:hypothetical protein